MKNRKIIKTIMGCLYMIPFVAVLGLTAYATFNENAKDSYSGTKVSEIEYTSVDSLDLMRTGKEYKFNPTSINNNASLGSGNTRTYFISLTYQTNTYENSYFYYYKEATQLNNYWVYIVKSDGTSINFLSTNQTFTFIFDYTQLNELNYANTGSNFLSVVHTNNFYLDYAFDYGIDRFNDLGFDKLGFSQYFTDLFVTTPNRYVTFVNNYFNYFLLVTCVSVLPRILYWFVNFALSFTDKFVSKDKE